MESIEDMATKLSDEELLVQANEIVGIPTVTVEGATDEGKKTTDTAKNKTRSKTKS